MKYLITGTGRCGTGYISKVLTSVGMNCTHEQVFDRRGPVYAEEQIALRRKNPWWGWEGESSWLAAPFLDRPFLKGITVVHLVRHPKDFIDSVLRLAFYTHPAYGAYFNWARKYLPTLDKYPTPLEKAAHWYIEFNHMVEPHADVRHRVEDNVCFLLNELIIDYQLEDIFDNKRYNHRDGYGPSDVNLNELPEPLRLELWRMASRYGYEYGWSPAKPSLGTRVKQFFSRLSSRKAKE